MSMTLKELAKELAKGFKFFELPAKNGSIQVFNTTKCEICEVEICDINEFGVGGVTARDLMNAGMTQYTRPLDEGGWSELHGMATCTPCCYDPDAKKKSASKE